MARPRTPTSLKVVRGTAQHNPQRLNRDEPTLGVAPDVRPPAWLRLSPLARRAWRDLRPLLADRMKVLTEADLIALATLCESLATWVEARKELKAAGGPTYESVREDGSRMLRKHPAVEVGAEAVRFAKLMLTEFGLTPAARSKVSRVGGSAKDPLEQWLDEGTGS